MRNNGEELSYWYFRLNGFFPLSNFVIHRTETTKHPSDCDILALRPPDVFEEVGGQSDDWDDRLTKLLRFDRFLGVIVEVKTGRYTTKDLFQDVYVRYSVGRLGLTQQIDNIMAQLAKAPVAETESGHQIAKILIANQNPGTNINFIAFSLGSIRNFIRNRMRKYQREKFRDRLFFDSNLLQELIDGTVQND